MSCWQENDAQLHLENTSALATRADDFSPHDVTPLHQLIVGHKGPQNMAVVGAMANLGTRKTELEEKALDLVLKQLCYDVEVWRVHTQKCSGYGQAVQWQKHAWNVQRHRQIRAAAEAFLKQQVLVLKNNDPTATLMEFMNWKKATATSLQIPEERMHTFALLNLIAPSTTSPSYYDLYGTLVVCVEEGPTLLGLAVRGWHFP